jgi:hypothetical protein
MTRTPVEAIEGLEEIVTRWIDQRIDKLRDELYEELGAERVARQDADEHLSAALDSLDRAFQDRTSGLV